MAFVAQQGQGLRCVGGEDHGIELFFARLGAVLMLAPGWGEQVAPASMRLGVAVLVTAVLAPSLASHAPAMPRDIINAIPMILTEVITGLILGMGARLGQLGRAGPDLLFGQ